MKFDGLYMKILAQFYDNVEKLESYSESPPSPLSAHSLSSFKDNLFFILSLDLCFTAIVNEHRTNRYNNYLSNMFNNIL